MNVQNMQSLAQALTSGGYIETTPSHALRSKDTKGNYQYMVIGVMADVYITHNPNLAYWEPDADVRFPSKFILRSNGEPWRLDIPQEVLEWYGLTREQSNQLWVMSARGYTFQQIGEAIIRSIKVGKKG